MKEKLSAKKRFIHQLYQKLDISISHQRKDYQIAHAKVKETNSGQDRDAFHYEFGYLDALTHVRDLIIPALVIKGSFPGPLSRAADVLDNSEA